jgi:DNA-binding Lrp family transcriptional regulator
MAYVMINSETGYESEVMKELEKIPGVQAVYQLYGVYDIIIKIEAEDLIELKEIVSLRIRKLEKIRTSLTLICIK